MFGSRKKRAAAPYDRTAKTPVIRSSICTGEQVAGFRDNGTGRFTEVMLIRGESDLLEFMRVYGVERGEIKREW